MAVAVAIGAYVFIGNPAWDKGLMLIGFTCMLVLEAISWRNRKRPVLEIRDDEIRYAPWPVGRERRVPLREIAGIQIARWKRATLQLRSGRRIVVNLKLIEGIDRERAVSALERAAGSAPA
jgi:hypothetical protein